LCRCLGNRDFELRNIDQRFAYFSNLDKTVRWKVDKMTIPKYVYLYMFINNYFDAFSKK